MGPALTSVRRVVIIGHLWINLPVLVLIAGVAEAVSHLIGPPDEHSMGLTALMAHSLRIPIGLVIGSAVAWLWWSFSVPRWRAWGVRRCGDLHGMQAMAQRTGLVWRKGSIFAKAEFRLRSQR
jgi:hypothetical protein